MRMLNVLYFGFCGFFMLAFFGQSMTRFFNGEADQFQVAVVAFVLAVVSFIRYVVSAQYDED